MPQYEGSAMAPDLLKYKDTYYIYYPAAGTNWVMWAKISVAVESSCQT